MLVSDQSAGLQSAFYSGLQGLNNGQSMIRQGSGELAQYNKSNVDINGAAVSLITGALQANASGEVIKRADGMIGTIIDTYA